MACWCKPTGRDGSWPLGPVLREESRQGLREGVTVLREGGSLPSPTGHPRPLTARDMQAGGAEGLASSVGCDAGVGALVLWAHVQQDQAVLLG